LLRTISNLDQDVGDITFALALRLAFLTQVRDIDDEATLSEHWADTWIVWRIVSQ
jgi:hypothetical protein